MIRIQDHLETGEIYVPLKSVMAKVSSSSELAGITYENAFGRHVAFYWQSEGGAIYQSTFLQQGLKWQLKDVMIVVATGAKLNTPIAAVTWANGSMRAVYFLNSWNLICERLFDDVKYWSDGTLNGFRVPVRSNSNLGAAVCYELGMPYLYVYYQNWRNHIRRLRQAPSQGWHESPIEVADTNALSGTSIASQTEVGACHWVTILNNKRYIRQIICTGGKWESIEGNDLVSVNFDRSTKISSVPEINGIFRFYCCNDNKAIEKKRVRTDWWDRTHLPRTTGVVRRNTVALAWAQDIDNHNVEVHLFSLQDDRIMDYVVGTPTEASFSLTEEIGSTS